MADNTARIAEIRGILAGGVKTVSYDGTTTEYDLAALRAELRQLQLEDDEQRANRPVASSIYLGGF